MIKFVDGVCIVNGCSNCPFVRHEVNNGDGCSLLRDYTKCDPIDFRLDDCPLDDKDGVIVKFNETEKVTLPDDLFSK